MPRKAAKASEAPRRVMLDPQHDAHERRNMTVLIVIGVLVIVGVWFLQLRTMMNRQTLAEIQESFAAFEQTLQAEYEATDIPEAGVNVQEAASVIGEAMRQEMETSTVVTEPSTTSETTTEETTTDTPTEATP